MRTLHDGLRCSICAEVLKNGEDVTVQEGEKVFSIGDPDFKGPIRIVWHPVCLTETLAAVPVQ